MNQSQERIDEANAIANKARDDRATCLLKTFSGQATPEQAEKTLKIIRELCFADGCPAHLANYDANRTFHFTGRQAVWREIEAILNTEIKHQS